MNFRILWVVFNLYGLGGSLVKRVSLFLKQRDNLIDPNLIMQNF
jgi:hypothetical protein